MTICCRVAGRGLSISVDGVERYKLCKRRGNFKGTCKEYLCITGSVSRDGTVWLTKTPGVGCLTYLKIFILSISVYQCLTFSMYHITSNM